MKLFETKIQPKDVFKINKVLFSGELGFGPNVSLFEEEFKDLSLKQCNIATNSASASAFMIFAYLREKYGVCDVYTTSLGFTSPAWAAKHLGHNLFFVDVEDDLQFSSADYKKRRTKTSNQIVLMPVLYGGVSNIEHFSPVGDEIIVVDSAHCVTPTIESDFTFFSFHPYKPICTSDGGMISTDDHEAEEYFRAYRNFGRSPTGSSYTVNQNGFKFYMNNLNATIGLTQIEKYKQNIDIRKNNYIKLNKKFNLLAHDNNSSYYFATTLTEDAEEIIKKTGIARHYPMLHKMPFYDSGTILENLEEKHKKILNLPLHTEFK
jgi:dTDP-4-amino-4,6-dideoxygalactose transaminase